MNTRKSLKARKNPRNRSWMLLAILAGMIPACFGLIGCGDDFGPQLAPGNGTGDGGEEPDPEPDPDIPPIPKPAAANADAPMESETYTVTQQLNTHFRPMVTSVHGTFTLRSRACLAGGINCCTAWATPYSNEQLWSASIPTLTYGHGKCDWVTSLVEPQPFSLSEWGEVLLMKDGAMEPAASGVFTTFEGSGGNGYERQYTWATVPLTNQPHIRRDRRWVRQQLSDGSFVVELAPNTEVTFTTSQTSGVSLTESETFAETVSVTGGLSGKGITASIEYTVTRSFTTSTTVWEETTEEVSRTVRGEAGKQTVFMLWGLEEMYSITDANGDPFTDPNYQFDLKPAVFRGTRFALDATTFDLP
ncbi:MAG TPA: hypothetical protein VKU85_07830 [bacterium]|nr:hypothetical protein [bacterium]